MDIAVDLLAGAMSHLSFEARELVSKIPEPDAKYMKSPPKNLGEVTQTMSSFIRICRYQTKAFDTNILLTT